MIARTTSRKLNIEFGLLRRVDGGAGRFFEIRGICGVQGGGLFRVNGLCGLGGIRISGKGLAFRGSVEVYLGIAVFSNSANTGPWYSTR